MSQPLILGRFSIGIGDRFAHQAQAQLRACQLALERGVEVIPVWNKSNREHSIIGSEPAATRAAADAAVTALGWKAPHFLDADHIRLETVGRFLPHCDFYTTDVADVIGQPAAPEAVEAFLDQHPELVGRQEVAGIADPIVTTRDEVRRIAGQFLKATQEAGTLYRHIAAAKGAGRFITEVSMDETDAPQTNVLQLGSTGASRITLGGTSGNLTAGRIVSRVDGSYGNIRCVPPAGSTGQSAVGFFRNGGGTIGVPGDFWGV